MILLNPTWLFALGALLIPVAIHLWNIRPGKTLKVGSISLIDRASRKSSRSFNLSDFLLLLLRCTLLVLIAIFLAVPIWQRLYNSKGVKGWLLIPKESFTEGYQKFKPQIDSLTKAGYEFHYFNKGFAKAPLADLITQNKANKMADSITNQVADYWQRLQQLNEQVPAHLPVALFTPNSSRHFTGNKPAVALNLSWQVYTPADSLSTWVQAAWLSNSGTIRVVQGNSKPAGTSFTYADVKTDDERNSPYHISVNNGQIGVSLRNTPTQLVIVDTATQQLAIYTDKYAADARYLKAALTSISDFTRHKTEIRLYTDAEKIPKGQSWIYWLSDKPIGDNLLKKGNHIFYYQAGKINEVNTSIKSGNLFSVAQSDENIALTKLITATKPEADPIWHDGFGQPVLTSIEKDHATVYQFYTHFNPAWNDLVWSDDFPKLILKLTTAKTETGPSIINDRTVLGTGQIKPEIVSSETALASKPSEHIDLSHYFWLALIGIFIIERLLAHQSKLSTANG